MSLEKQYYHLSDLPGTPNSLDTNYIMREAFIDLKVKSSSQAALALHPTVKDWNQAREHDMGKGYTWPEGTTFMDKIFNFFQLNHYFYPTYEGTESQYFWIDTVYDHSVKDEALDSYNFTLRKSIVAKMRETYSDKPAIDLTNSVLVFLGFLASVGIEIEYRVLLEDLSIEYKPEKSFYYIYRSKNNSLFLSETKHPSHFRPTENLNLRY